MNNIIFFILAFIWYFFSVIGFYNITSRNFNLNLSKLDKFCVFILCLFFPIILGALGFAIIMTEIEEKIK